MQVSDYTIDNLLMYLKALRALGLWKMEWREVGTLLGVSEPDLAVASELDNVLIGKMATALGLPENALWSDLLRALKLGRDASLAQIVDALYERKHDEELGVTTIG